ncbi:unnamed protein product [Paramecium sonneborni]|uniref:Cyclin-dependent kinase 2 homolog n=1 Tax=Paramecium sonneborni TaxID=65129 RepID=A0A8S1NRB3_9CILI|nr:unnamed protein product [Paramecium sonneborni]
MYQQNQSFQLGQGYLIKAPTQNYSNRQFKILQQIGNGSEGSVFKATPINWSGFQQEVALKFQTVFKEELKEFYNKIIEYQNKYESSNGQYIYSSNVIRIYDYFVYQNMLVTVMELGSMDLYQYIQNTNLTIQQKQSILLQILTSITFLHSQNIFHRDIKPENYILVGSQVKLVDFGLIKLQINNQRLHTQKVGTQLFQAPELIEGKSDYTFAVDVWAMALVFYEILKGQSIFQVQTFEELNEKIKQHIQNQSYIYNKFDELPISDEWKTTMKRMAHPNPNERITSKEALDILSKSSIQTTVKLQNSNAAISLTQSQMIQIKQIPPSPIQPQMQQQFQLNISTQINNIIQVLSQSTNFNFLLQQKEQSTKQLSTLKDLSLRLLTQLDPNYAESNSNEIQEFNSENQKQIQKKQLQTDIKDDYEQIKKSIQQLEEKCMLIQEEQELDKKTIDLKNNINKLNIIVQKFENKQQDLQKLEDELKELKQKQKLILKKNLILDEIDLIKKSNDTQGRFPQNQLQKDINELQKQIQQLELEANNIQYFQEQKKKLEQTILILQQQIKEGENAEKEFTQTKNDLVALKIELELNKKLDEEIKNNEKIINELKVKIEKLEQNLKFYDNQQNEMDQLNEKLQELKELEDKVKKNKEMIILMRAQLRELPNQKRQFDQQQKEADKLRNEIKPLGELQNNIDSLNEQIKKLIEQKNLKLEKQEEERNLQYQKEQLEKELNPIEKSQSAYKQENYISSNDKSFTQDQEVRNARYVTTRVIKQP